MSNFFQSLFIGTSNQFANIELDARLTERFDVSTVITDHPIDTGALISDHAYLNPEIYILEGVVSDLPLSFIEAAKQIGSNALNLLSDVGVLFGAADEIAPASKRSVAAFNSLLEFWRDITPFDVQTAMGIKQNMLIQSLTAVVDNDTANMLRFTAVLREVVLVPVSIVVTDNLEEGNVQESGGAVASKGVNQAVTSPVDITVIARGTFE